MVQKCVVYGYSNTKEEKRAAEIRCQHISVDVWHDVVTVCKQGKDDTISSLAEM